jgi:P pilus assembly chaperone PapD
MMQMRVGIPVFIAPQKPRGSAELAGAGLVAGRLRLRLTNPGNRHVRLLSVSATLEGADGSFIAAHELPAWYLLAGGARAYELAVDPGECLATRAFRVAARWSDGSLSGRVEVPAGACR